MKTTIIYFHGRDPVSLEYTVSPASWNPAVMVWEVSFQPVSLDELTREPTDQPLHVVSHAA